MSVDSFPHALCPRLPRSSARMGQWNAKYSHEQRAAIVHAYAELRVRPAANIPRLAARGELRPDASADPLPAFDIPASTVISIGRAAERRKAGRELRPDLAKLAPRDRAEQLQLRLTALIDSELARLEDQRRRYPLRGQDVQQMQRIARALRELATIPDWTEKRLPRTPGARDDTGRQPDGTTTGGLAGKLLSAVDASMPPMRRNRPAQDEPPLDDVGHDTSTTTLSATATTNGHAPQDDEPEDDEHAC